MRSKFSALFQGLFIVVAGLLLLTSFGKQTARAATPTYIFTHLAGSSDGGPGSSDGTGKNARFDFPAATAVDAQGNVYVADANNDTIRKITSAGVVTTLAGAAHQPGFADGVGSAARFYNPAGIAVDQAGVVYVADEYNSAIRKITPDGVVTTWLGADYFAHISSLAVDSAGTVYTIENGNIIHKITQQGEVTNFVENNDFTGPVLYSPQFALLSGICVDATGNVFVTDFYDCDVIKITSTGAETIFAGTADTFGFKDGIGLAATFYLPTGIAANSEGSLYVSSALSQVRKITADAVVTTIAGAPYVYDSADGIGSAAHFNNPSGLSVDSAENVYVADSANNSIRKIDLAGTVTTFAGFPVQPGSADGIGSASRFNKPEAIVLDAAGNIYVADQGNCTIRKVTPNGVVTTLAGAPGQAGSVDGVGADARFATLNGIAIDQVGNLYVTDAIGVVRKITSAGIVTTLAGDPSQLGSTDGVRSAALFQNPFGITVDPQGNLYVADIVNDNIRKITQDGLVTTIAGKAQEPGYVNGDAVSSRFNQPTSICLDGTGNLYVSDTGNNFIRKITPDGVVTTLAGNAENSAPFDGIGLDASFTLLGGMSADQRGNLYVIDRNSLRRITPEGVVSTIAGTFDVPGNIDGNGTASTFNLPGGIAVDAAGNLYLADSGNHAIRKGALIDPQIILATAPTNQIVRQGKMATFSVAATSNLALDYRWQVMKPGTSDWIDLIDSSVYAGTTTSQLSINNVTAAMDGSEFRCTISNGVALDSSTPAAQLTVPKIQLINISTRALVGAGANIQIAGFVITGTEPKQVLVRANGPSLALIAPQLKGLLPDPTLRLINNVTGEVIGTNTGWNSASNFAQIKTTVPQVGATTWPDGSKDSALLVTLSPGLYTAQVSGQSGDSGIALVEVFDADGTADTRLINISTRSYVGTADNIQIAGFVIAGTVPKQVLIRASGPALKSKLDGSLPDPSLTLISAGAVVGSNTIWGSAANAADIQTTATRVGAFDWDAGSKDSAILITLQPGIYTALVSGATNDTGIALVEVYDAD